MLFLLDTHQILQKWFLLIRKGEGKTDRRREEEEGEEKEKKGGEGGVRVEGLKEGKRERTERQKTEKKKKEMEEGEKGGRDIILVGTRARTHTHTHTHCDQPKEIRYFQTTPIILALPRASFRVRADNGWDNCMFWFKLFLSLGSTILCFSLKHNLKDRGSQGK